MLDQTAEPQRLAACCSSPDGPMVVQLGSTDAVILAVAKDGTVLVWRDGTVANYAAESPAEPVFEPVRRDAALRQAIISLNALRREAETTAEQQATQHATTLASIRQYAIEAHRDGDICRGGLDEFLYAFNLEQYRPRTRLSYTLTGSFTATGDSMEAVLAAVTAELASSYALVDGIDDDSTEHDASVRDVRPVSLDDGRNGFAIDFAITGTYEVSDTYDPEAAGQRYLRPDLDTVPGVIPDSVRFMVDSIEGELVY